MHVLQRPHLSPAVGVSIVAALLAIAITLLVATASGGLGTSGGSGATAPPAVPAALSGPRSLVTPAWVSDPFASPPRAPLP